MPSDDEYKRNKGIASSILTGAGLGAGGSIVYDNLTKGGVTSALQALAKPSAVDSVSGATPDVSKTSAALDTLKAVPNKISSGVKTNLDSASKWLGFEGLEAANKAVGNAVAVGLGGAAGGALAHLVVKGAKAAGRKLKGDMSSKPKDILQHIDYVDSHFKSMKPIINYGKKHNIDNHENWKDYLESASSVKRATPAIAGAYTRKVNRIAAEAKAEGK